VTKGNRSGKETYSCCHFRSSYLTVLSRNCLKNGASCGYPAPASDNLDPSANVTVEPGPLLPSITPSNTSTTPILNLPRSQGTLESTSASKHHRTEVISWYSNMTQPSFSTILPATRTDPFHTLPLELSRESKMLLDHCKSTLTIPSPLAATSASDFSPTALRYFSHKQPNSASKDCAIETRIRIVSICNLRCRFAARRTCPSCQQLDEIVWWPESFY
jgi:hypothetical protein